MKRVTGKVVSAITAVMLGLAASVGGAASMVAPAVKSGEIGGVVTGARGPEAGVWVIAESGDFATRYAKIVVTDEQGRFLIPDLPRATYQIWVRGYGLEDSKKTRATPGSNVNLAVRPAASAAVAAQIYPAAYWYAMMNIPSESEVAQIPGGRNAYLIWVKNEGCVGCHQMGDLSTRTIPSNLGVYDSTQSAWIRRIQSGQAGRDMVSIAMGTLKSVPIKYLAEWTDRIAKGELPSQTPQRPSGHRAQRCGHRARLVDTEGLPARPFGHGSQRPNRQRLRPALWGFGAQQRRHADFGPAAQCRELLPRAGARRRYALDPR